MVIVTSLVTFTGCKNYDDDIASLQKEIATLTTGSNSAIDIKIKGLTDEINALKTKVTALEANGATDDEVAAVKADILSKTVSLEAFNAYKATVTAELAAITAELATKATTANLDAKILEVKTAITTLGGQLDVKIAALDAKIANLAIADGEIKARLAILEGLLKVSNGKSAVLDGFTTQLATQLSLINANTLNITTIQNQLKDLLEKQNKNTADIALINNNLKTLVNAMGLNFASLSSRLTSLEFVPEFFVNGIESMNFSPLESNCKIISASVIVAYHLNPSFITKEDIEINNLSFAVLKSTNIITYMGAPALAADTRVKGTFVKIEDGKIFVSVSVEDFNDLLGGSNVTGGSIEKFSMIALQIPLSEKAVKENKIEFDTNGKMVIVGSTTYPAARLITSNYARLYNQNMKAQTDVYLAKVMPTNPESYLKLPQTVAGAIALTVNGVDGATVTDPLVISLPFEKTINLSDYIKAIFKNQGFDVEKYGLKFKFDLLNDNLATPAPIVYIRGVNMMDQQAFINISDNAKGTINATKLTPIQIDDAKGRTPIVRVTMYNDQDPNCSVLMSFVKVLIEEGPYPDPITVPFIFEDLIAGCSNTVGVLTLEQMNLNLYNRLNLTKEEFHNIYPSVNFSYSGDGVVAEEYTVNGLTDYLLNWTLTASQVWAKLMLSNPATFTGTAKYISSRPNTYPDITITFTRKFTLPENTLNVNTTIDNYWYSNTAVSPYPYIKHNIYVPNVGETNNALAVFSNNINQVFEQNLDKSLKISANNYEYYFYLNQPILDNGLSGGIQLTPSPDGKTLLNGGEVVATIKPFVSNTGDILELNKASETAKLLLNQSTENMKARIGIRTLYCESIPDTKMSVTVKGNPFFDVIFVRPINPQPAADQYFVDALNFGDKYTYLEISKLTNLNDWRYNNAVASFATHFNYYSYYGVTNITADIANIRTDLNQAPGVKVPLSQYPDIRVAYVASIPGVNNPAPTNPKTFFGYITYNNTGSTLGKLFSIYVPATITYSWGTILSTEIKVDVWKTVGGSGVKRK